MALVVVTPPQALLALGDAKAHLRVDGTDEDTYVLALIAAAQGAIDGPPGWLGISIGAQVLELRAASFDGVAGNGLLLPYGPVTGIVSVSYVASDGTLGAVDPAVYALDGDALGLAPTRMWPVIGFRSDAVRVRYATGFSPTADQPPKPTVPPAILHALKVMVALMYEDRLGAADL